MRNCFMCGGYCAPAVEAPDGAVCAACALVCVEVTLDRLAGKMAARWGRNPYDTDEMDAIRRQIFPLPAGRIAA